MAAFPAPVTLQLWVGVDIAATTFTAAWTRDAGAISNPRTYPQDFHGFARLQTDLQATGIAPAETVIVREATGSYWIALAVTLHDASYRVSVINPLQAHHFAKAQLRRAKTDALDAHAAQRAPAHVLPQHCVLPCGYHRPPCTTRYGNACSYATGW